MTDINEVTLQKATINKKIDEYQALEDEIKRLLLSLARELCPFNIGDTVKNVGWTHTGRMMRVDRIGATTMTSRTYRGDWEVHGTVLKNNGELSKLTADFNQKNYEEYLRNEGPCFRSKKAP